MDEVQIKIVEAIIAILILLFIIYGLHHWVKIDHKHRREKTK